jgi:26S proteasome regulatory subunit N10
MQDDETALLQQALAMSMAEAAAAAAAAGASSGDVPMVGSGGDDQDLAFALQMSMQEEAALASGDNADMSKVLGDQSFLSSILSSLPGVDPNDPSVQDVLASLQADDEEQKKDKTESKDKEGQ